jgi:hypothetical protein
MLSMPRIVRPDLFRSRETEIGSPVGLATRRPIKRNKELAKLLTAMAAGQVIAILSRSEKELDRDQAYHRESRTKRWLM